MSDREQPELLEELKAQGYKAWIIRTELEYVVVARTEEEAVSHSRQAVRDDSFMDENFEAQPMSYLPGGWEGESLVYGSPQGDLPADVAAKLPGGYAHKPEVEGPTLFDELQGEVSKA